MRKWELASAAASDAIAGYRSQAAGGQNLVDAIKADKVEEAKHRSEMLDQLKLLNKHFEDMHEMSIP